jgi:hypothetical protein
VTIRAIREHKLEFLIGPFFPLPRREFQPVQLSDETLGLLWLAAGAVGLWMLLPAVLNALGLTFHQSSIEEDPSALEPVSDDADYQELFAQLRSLGFEPIGKRTTTCWFFLHHWRKTFTSRVFAARQGDAIALVYKLRAWDQWRLCFVTAFYDGAILETANQMASFRIDEPDHLRWGLATPDRALLLERHRQVCREFAATGSRRIAKLPAEQVNQFIMHHDSRHHRMRHRWTGLKGRAASLWLLGVGLPLVRWYGGTAPYLVPVAIIAWGFLWPAVHAYLFRIAAGSFRAADTRSQKSQPTS